MFSNLMSYPYNSTTSVVSESDHWDSPELLAIAWQPKFYRKIVVYQRGMGDHSVGQ